MGNVSMPGSQLYYISYYSVKPHKKASYYRKNGVIRLEAF